jgi:hypothetical protein
LSGFSGIPKYHLQNFFFCKCPGGLKAARLHAHPQQQGLLLLSLTVYRERMGKEKAEKKGKICLSPPSNPTIRRPVCQA